MSKTARQETVEALTELLKGSPNIFVTDFTGLNVLRMTSFAAACGGRRDYVVVKNTWPSEPSPPTA
jgi:ribosomal protein L10